MEAESSEPEDLGETQSEIANEGLKEESPSKGKGSKNSMKKHDSGVSFEKPDTSSSSEEDVAANSSGSMIPSKTASEQSSPDSGLQGEFSEGMGPSSPLSTTSECDASTPQDRSSDSTKTQNSHRQTNKSSEMTSPDQIDLDDDEVIFESSDSDKIESDTEKKPKKMCYADMAPKTERPSHKWFICKEVLSRQYGQLSSISNALFRLRCCSSLHMVERLELMYKMEKHDGCVNALHFNEDGTKLVSSSDDLKVIIWDWTISKPVLMYDSGHRSNVFQAKYLPLSGDSHIVSCARDGQVRLAELSSTGVCKRTRRLAQHRDSVHKLALENDSPHTFLSCGEDGVIFEIDLRCCKPEKLLTCRENEKLIPFYTIYNNPVKTYEFAAGGKDKYIRIYDKRCIRELGASRKLCPHHLINAETKPNVSCLVYNHNGTEILATYNDDDIYSFDANHSDGADCTHRYFGHRNNQTIKGVSYYGPNSEFIISGSDCGNIFFWEHDSEHIVQYMHGDEGGVVNCLEPHPNCPILATSGLDNDIKIWVPSCENPPTLEGLHSTISKNMENREEDRNNDTQDLSDQLLWFLMQQGRRSTRRRMRHHEEDSDSSSSNDSSIEDDETGRPRNIQCYQS